MPVNGVSAPDSGFRRALRALGSHHWLLAHFVFATRACGVGLGVCRGWTINPTRPAVELTLFSESQEAAAIAR